jgi:hypothetical protein
MWRFYHKLGEDDRRTIRNWQIAVLGGYSAIFLLVVAAAAGEHMIGRWITKATQAEMTSSIKPAVDPTQLTVKAN